MRVEPDSLLGSEEPNGTFHDALLLDLQVNYASLTLVADLSLCVGAHDAPSGPEREQRRSGRLHLEGLFHFSLEPSSEGSPLKGPLWIDAGILEDARTETAAALALVLPADCFACYFFLNEANAFAYLASRDARFEWD